MIFLFLACDARVAERPRVRLGCVYVGAYLVPLILLLLGAFCLFSGLFGRPLRLVD